MGIEPGTKSIAHFQRHSRRVFMLLGVVSQLLLTASVGILIANTQLLSWQSLPFWVILLAIFIIGTILTLLLLRFVLEPQRDMLAALMHKAGEATTLAPPNPNHKRHATTGFKTVLQTIYRCPDSSHAAPAPASTDTILTQALNNTSCGVVVLNPQKQIITANRAAPIAQAQDGRSYLALDFIDDQSLEEWLADIDGTTVNAERRWRRVATDPDVIRDTKIYDIVASYQKDAPGETVVMLFDRSERYLPEEEDLNFIAFAAHELRGPITIIRGYLDVLEQELADRLIDDEPQLLERLTVSANRLSGYINNILNVARFDRHHLKVHLAEDTVAHIYASIADDMQLRASTQHRLLSVNLPDTLPTVAADRGSISEVIGNLVDNAIKYSFEGGTVSVTAEQKGDFVEVSVTDNGVGMPASVVKNLFHKFYRSHRSREAVAGTGIGLYICKAFVESHGGTISARSRENEGSVFSFTLPIYDTVKDKLLEDGQLNSRLVRQGGGWIKNHAMYRG
ncbi:MAG: HAMP domain-containing sensor histidine kinase [Candidatus Saccharibacteria bacterium]|nr:HAMP domain-containing sensor histidine kinase [Candidatus Saccharibacteria bacterium]